MIFDGQKCQLWVVVPRYTTVERKESKERREKVGGGPALFVFENCVGTGK